MSIVNSDRKVNLDPTRINLDLPSDLSMSLQVVELVERSTAYLTLVRFKPGVDTVMAVEDVFVSERLVALETFIWPHTVMDDTPMTLQVVPSRKHLWTVATW